MSPRLSHLLETSLYVRDLDVSRDFYHRVFGLPTLHEDEGMVGLELPGNAVLLLFREGGSVGGSEMPGGFIPGHGAHGPQHVCIGIPLAALSDWDRHLSLLGIVIESRVVQMHGGTSLYFRDPDGHSVELATPGLWANY